MKKIVIATKEENPTFIKMLAHNIENAVIADFESLWNIKDESDRVYISNYTLSMGEVGFLKRNNADGVYIIGDDGKEELIRMWVDTPHLRVFYQKDIQGLLKNISNLISSDGIECERKFLIKYPHTELLNSLDCCRGVKIEQMYLKADENGGKARIRKRGEGEEAVYIKTLKQKISDVQRLEKEDVISKAEYEALSKETEDGTRPIKKVRYCLMYENRYYEIDVFPFWKNQAYIEIELEDENEKIAFPPFIEVIREVTFDSNYTNRALSKAHPPEDL